MTTTRIPIAFAQDGTRTAIDLTRPDGVVNLTQGYTDDYSRQLGTDPAAKAIERDKMNWLLNILSSNIIDWQQSAVPQYLAQTQYDVPAMVRFAPSGTTENIYRAIATPPVGTIPTNTDFWEEILSQSVLRALIPMPYRAIIGASTDFNTFVSNGTWVFSATNISSYANAPANAVSGMLEVRLTTSAAVALVQRYTDTSGGIYTRGRTAAGTWSPWLTIAFPIPVSQGGTGATTAAGARTNLGLGTAATYDVGTSGSTVPLLVNGNTWGGIQIIAGSGTNSGTLQLVNANGQANNGTLIFGTAGSSINYNGAALNYYNAANGQTTTLAGGGTTWTSGNFDPGTKVNKAGDFMTGGLDVRAEFLVTPPGGQRIRLSTDSTGCFFDSRNSAASVVPNGNAYYRAFQHAWANIDGNVRMTLNGGGGLTTTGGMQCTNLRAMGGTFATQSGLVARGWDNGVTRWLDVIEADGSMSLYSYNSAGAGGVQLLQFRSTSAGGSNFLALQGGFSSTGPITGGGAFTSTGSIAGFTMPERSDSSVSWSSYANASAYRIWCSTAGDRLTLDRAGNMNVTGAMSASGFDVGSSPKLKDIDGAIPYGLREVREASKLIGAYKGSYSSDQTKRLFFDADQMADLMPELVNVGSIPFNGEMVNSIRTEGVGPVAFNAISELADQTEERIEQLERDNRRLEELVERLASRLSTLEGGA